MHAAAAPWHRRLGGSRVEHRHQFRQLSDGSAAIRAARDAGIIVQIETRPRQAVGDHLIPGRGLAALLLAKHFGVVDFPDLDCRTAIRRPETGDASLGRGRRPAPRREQQEGAPRLGVATRMNRQLADQMVVQERRELGDRWIGARVPLAVDEQPVGEDPDPIGLGEAAGGGQADDPAEGGGNCRVRGRVQDETARAAALKARANSVSLAASSGARGAGDSTATGVIISLGARMGAGGSPEPEGHALSIDGDRRPAIRPAEGPERAAPEPQSCPIYFSPMRRR